MDYESMTLLELKKICKERGLRLSGKKDDVIIRLMEDDEGEEESRVSVGSSSDNTVLIKIDGPDRFMISIGTFIIMYSIFRGGIALMFITEAHEILTALLALVIAAAFMAGGVLTVLNYRNGLIITLGTLGLSGLLSLLFSGGFNPLSIVWETGGIGHVISMMCSAVCMVFVGIPLLTSVNTLKPGWPGESETSSSPGSSNISSKERKITVACPYCDKNLRVPSDYSGKVRCTHCDELMEV
jgi:hypothetical protein